jgi:hypothetical protein
MKPISTQTIKKSVASTLIAALVLTAPGLSPYQALAKGSGGGALRTSGITGASKLNIGNISPGAIPGNLGSLGVSGQADLTPIAGVAGEDLVGLSFSGAPLGIGETRDIQLLNNDSVGSVQNTASSPAGAVGSVNGTQISGYGQGTKQVDDAVVPVKVVGQTGSGSGTVNETGPMTRTAAARVGRIKDGMPTVTKSQPGVNLDTAQREFRKTYEAGEQGKTGAGNSVPVVGETGITSVGMHGNNLLADAGGVTNNRQ